MSLYRKATPEEVLRMQMSVDVTKAETKRAPPPHVQGRRAGVCQVCQAPGWSPLALYCDEHWQYDKAEKAHKKVAAAVKRGDLKPARECKCVDCGGQARDYDHRDYAKPLEVEPVCRRCNSRRGAAKAAQA